MRLDPSRLTFLAGGGEMGSRMRDMDWSSSALGPPDTWPQSLRSTVSMLLPSKAQIIVFWGPELIVLYNDAYRPVFGAKHPHVLGLPGREAWSEIWESQLHPLLRGVVETGEAFHARDLLFVLERYGFVEETYFDVSYDPVRIESGDVGGVFCIVTETTERVVGERRLALLRDLAARNTTARTQRDACVLAIETLTTAKADVAFARAYLGDELQAETPDAGRLMAEAPANLVQTLSMGSSPGGGAARLVVGINPRRPFDEGYRSFLDLVADQLEMGLTNAGAYEAERRRAEALAAVDRAKTTFFSNVSHEFRTPLTLLVGPLADDLADPTPLPAAHRERVETAHRNALRLLRLVNSLLDFSRIEAGRIDATYEPVDLAALTTDLASAFRSATEKAGLALIVDCPPLPQPVYVDRDMWEKVVLNLLSNAFKFTFDGEIRVELRWEEDHVELRVADTGIGIDDADLARIFERFHRIKHVRARTHEGTGIGLALVQELARLHGGTVAVASDVGHGTTFTVSVRTGTSHLPQDRISATRRLTPTGTGATPYVEEALRWLPTEGPAIASVAGSNETALPLDSDLDTRARVLIADDNADMRDYLVRILGTKYRVDAVPDGRTALDSIRADAPDLILTDVMMPDLDGFGLLAAVRDDESIRALPVVLLSARAGEEARIEGLHAGADEYLVKPFSARELLACVDSQLQLARLRQETLRLAQENAAVTETLNNVGGIVASDLDRDKVVQAVTDVATELTAAEFGAFFYNVIDDNGEAYTLYTISGVPRELFSKFPMPRNTAVFEPTFKGTAIVRSDDITKDPRYGHNAPYHGMPAGHLPVRSYLAAPVKGRGGIIGGLFFGHSATGRFTIHHERIVEGIATWAAVALENARLYRNVQDASRLKDDFLASLSHELRTPLNAILGYARMLRSGMVTPDKRQKAVETIERNATSLTQIVEDVLDISRIVSGKIRLNVQAVDFPAIVRNAIDGIAPAADAKGVRIDTHLDPDAAPVSGDPERLQQVLWNLLSNAVKFTNRGGTVVVRLERVNSHVELTVSDTGIGIPREFLPHVFERFRQADAGLTRERGGLGLGLSIARQLTELHGGTIEASSEGPGKGSTFRVTIPIMAVDATRIEMPRVQPRAPLGSRPDVSAITLDGIHVLALDDEQDALSLVAAALEAAHARVTTVRSAEEALNTLAVETPDVIVADLGMPRMDGFAFIERLRHHDNPRVRDVPAVAVTAYARSEDRMHALQAGFQIHLSKPIDPDELVTTIASLTRRIVVKTPATTDR